MDNQTQTNVDETQNQRETQNQINGDDETQRQRQRLRDKVKQKLEEFQELKSLIGEQEGRLQSLQNTAFQLANYYFVFQGVILAAISNTSSITCHDRWFLFTLSLLAAVINLCALFAIGVTYVGTMAAHAVNWNDYNLVTSELHGLEERLLSLDNNTTMDQPGGSANQVQSNYSGSDYQPWRDHFTENKRRFYLGVCVVLFLGFAGVTLSGCWRILCENGECKHQHYNDSGGGGGNCIKLCDGVKCMRLCDKF